MAPHTIPQARTLLVPAFVLAFLTLAGCDEMDGSPETGALVSNTLTVATSVPAADQNRIAVDANLEVTFSKALSLSSVDATQFTLHHYGVAVPAQVSFDGTTAILSPDDDLLDSAQYSATLNSGIVDTDGNALEQYKWEFYTDGNGWSTDELVEFDNITDAANPQIRFDSNGNAIAVWEYNKSIYANRFSATTASWATAELIETGSSFNLEPKVSMDSEDNIIVIWRNSANIYAKYFNASTSIWSASHLIELGNGSASDPHISIDADANGNAIAIWRQDDGVARSIYANRFNASTATWGTAVLIEAGNGAASGQPRIAIDADGNAIAVWYQTDGLEYNIYANRYDGSTASWDTAEIIETENGHAEDPQISIDSNGNATVVWSLYEGATAKIMASRYTASSDSWGSVELVSSGNGSPFQPKISGDASGNAVVVWAQNDGIYDNVYVNRYTASSATWATPEQIETVNSYADHVQLSTDDNGNANVIWQNQDGTGTEIVYASQFHTNTGTWVTEMLMLIDEDLNSPQISTDADGNTIAVWVQSDGTRDNIHSARFNPLVVAP